MACAVGCLPRRGVCSRRPAHAPAAAAAGCGIPTMMHPALKPALTCLLVQKLLKMMEDEDGSQGNGDQGKTR